MSLHLRAELLRSRTPHDAWQFTARACGRGDAPPTRLTCYLHHDLHTAWMQLQEIGHVVHLPIAVSASRRRPATSSTRRALSSHLGAASSAPCRGSPSNSLLQCCASAAPHTGLPAPCLQVVLLAPCFSLLPAASPDRPCAIRPRPYMMLNLFYSLHIFFL